MDAAAFANVTATFATFQAHFAPFFGRKEARARGEQYLRGLLVQQADRRNAENVAEAVAEATPRTLQRLLTEAPGDHEATRAAVQRYVAPRLAAAEGVFILDESAFPKRGDRSVGVARQWCGTLGKTAGCQVGVFLAYHAGHGQAVLARIVGYWQLSFDCTESPHRGRMIAHKCCACGLISAHKEGYPPLYCRHCRQMCST